MARIAVWNTAFLGDAVLTLPLLQSLRLSRPDAEIDFYVRKGVENLFQPHPALNAVFPVDKKKGGVSSLMQTAKEAAARKYDTWISAHTSLRSGFVAAASHAPVRIGYAKPLYNRLFYNRLVDRRFRELDEIERLLQLLLPLPGIRLSPWPELTLDQADEQKAEDFFRDIKAPVLGMHPGSVWPTKRWPAAYFAEIGRHAVEKGAHVLLFAGPGEEAVAQEVLDSVKASLQTDKHARLHNLSGSLALPLLAAFLKRLSCYLTNDSGPMHLAWAQRTPVTALFGPTVHDLGFFPRGKNASVLEIDLACRPCGLHGPKECPLGHHHCMTRLLPAAVWPDVDKKLFG